MQSKAKVVLEIVTDAQQAKKEAKQIGQKVAKSAEKASKKMSFGEKAKQQLQEMKKGVQVLGVGGDKLTKLGDFFTTGKLGVAVAAVATVAMSIVSIWDKMTLSIQQQINLFSSKLADAQKKTQDEFSTQQIDNSYVQRLKALIKLQPLHNSELKQATFLLDELTKRYGDLGISIDYVSGKILGLTGDLEKLNIAQKQKLFTQLKEQQASAKSLATAQTRLTLREFSKNDAITGAILDLASYIRGGENKNVWDAMQQIDSLPIEKQLEFFEKLRDYSRNDKELTAVNKIIQIKRQQLQIEQKLQSLGANGAMSAQEYAAQLKKLNEQGQVALSKRKFDTQWDAIQKVGAETVADKERYRFNALNTDREKSNFWQEKIDIVNKKISGLEAENLNLDTKRYADDDVRRFHAKQKKKFESQILQFEAKRAEKGLTDEEKKKEAYAKERLKQLRTATYKNDPQRYADYATAAANEREILQLKKQQAKYQEEIRKLKQRQQKFYKDNLDSVQGELKVQQLLLQGLYDQAEKQKLINQLKKQGISIDDQAINEIIQKQKELKKVQADKSLKSDALSLYDRLSPKNADTMYQQRMRKFREQGIELNSDQQDTLRQLVQLEFSADNLPKLDMSQFQIKTNELTARGGFKSGVVMPESDRINMAIMQNTKSQVQILTQVKDLLSKMGWI